MEKIEEKCMGLQKELNKVSQELFMVRVDLQEERG